MSSLIRNHWFLWTFLTLYFSLGFLTYKDYGPTSDEKVEYTAGRALISYYTGKDTPKDLNSRHLPQNSMYLRLYPALLVMLNPIGYYEWYHLLNIILGCIPFVLVYFLVFSWYKKTLPAAISVIFLFFTPRFTGDIPANPKDIPFAAVFLLGIFVLYKLVSAEFGCVHSFARLICFHAIFGFVLGLVTSFRVVGFSLFAVYLFFVFKSFFTQKEKLGCSTKYLLGFLTALFTCLLTMYLIFPYLRHTFPQGYANLFLNAARYEEWNNTILFNGKFLTRENRPDMYLPVWFLITTPAFIVLFFGIAFFVVRKNLLLELLTVILCTNVIIYFIVQPVVYNGIRHFLYLLPVVCLISSLGFYHLIVGHKNRKADLWVLFSVFFIVQSLVYIKLHPYEYVYFNELVRGLGGGHGRFESDYWGTSYKEMSEKFREFLSRTEQKYIPKVYACNLSWGVQYYSHGSFTLVGSSKEADYIMCDYDNDLKYGYAGEKVLSVTRLGVEINTIRKSR